MLLKVLWIYALIALVAVLAAIRRSWHSARHEAIGRIAFLLMFVLAAIGYLSGIRLLQGVAFAGLACLIGAAIWLRQASANRF